MEKNTSFFWKDGKSFPAIFIRESKKKEMEKNTL